MDNTHYISTAVLSLETVNEIISQQMSVELSDEAKINIQKCRIFWIKKWRLLNLSMEMALDHFVM
jgi:histidine ammonia-lyase